MSVGDSPKRSAPAPLEDWRPVDGKPHLYRDRVSGRMKYAPPLPPDAPFKWLMNAQKSKP